MKYSPLATHHSPLTNLPYLCPLTILNMNIEYNRNEDAMKLSLGEMRRRLDKIYEGGGKKAIEKQREKNKLTPKERIVYLIHSDNAHNSGFALQGGLRSKK